MAETAADRQPWISILAHLVRVRRKTPDRDMLNPLARLVTIGTFCLGQIRAIIF